MKAGRLRHRVTIQKPVETQNTYGEAEVRWQDVATVWASVEPLRGREYLAAKQMVSEVEVRVVIRYMAGITAKMKVVHGSDEYLIETVINVMERDREIQLMCTRFDE